MKLTRAICILVLLLIAAFLFGATWSEHEITKERIQNYSMSTSCSTFSYSLSARTANMNGAKVAVYALIPTVPEKKKKNEK